MRRSLIDTHQDIGRSPTISFPQSGGPALYGGLQSCAIFLLSGADFMLPATGVVLILGLGNRLLSDDAAGPMAIDCLSARHAGLAGAIFLDGGTIGLSLLPEIETAAALIAIDAASLGAAPGTVQVFEGAAMDRQLGGRKKTAHEVALADLLAAAALGGTLPERRALVAVEPQTTVLGMAPSAAVAAAIPQLCLAAEELLRRWSD